MSPDILVTDELSTKEDFDSVLASYNSGVKILASIHAKNIDDIKSKKEFKQLLENKVFKLRTILISKKHMKCFLIQVEIDAI